MGIPALPRAFQRALRRGGSHRSNRFRHGATRRGRRAEMARLRPAAVVHRACPPGSRSRLGYCVRALARNAHLTPRRMNRVRDSEGAPRSESSRAAPVASRSARVRAPASGACAASPARGCSEGAAPARSDGRDDRQDKRTRRRGPPRRAMSRPSSGGENQPRCTRVARAARASPVAPHAPRPSTERRPKRRRETRTTSGEGTREEEEEERAHHRGALCPG